MEFFIAPKEKTISPKDNFLSPKDKFLSPKDKSIIPHQIHRNLTRRKAMLKMS